MGAAASVVEAPPPQPHSKNKKVPKPHSPALVAQFPHWKQSLHDVPENDFLDDNIAHHSFNLSVSWENSTDSSGNLSAKTMLVNQPSTFKPFTSIGKRKGKSPFEGFYPLYFVPGIVILHLKRIPKHEELLRCGLLVPIKKATFQGVGGAGAGYDGVYDIEDFYYEQLEVDKDVLFNVDDANKNISYCLADKSGWTARKIFFSHRWHQHEDGAMPTPDDKINTKLDKMKTKVKPDDLVWFDYMCIPQDSQDQQLNAIQSLPYYISCSDVVHILTTTEENRAQYKTRAFCNLELVCASLPLVNGTVTQGYGSEIFSVDVDSATLCEIFDEDGSIAYPFLSPHKANMYNPADLEKLVKVLERIQEACKATMATASIKDKDKEKCQKLLQLIDTRVPDESLLESSVV